MPYTPIFYCFSWQLCLYAGVIHYGWTGHLLCVPPRHFSLIWEFCTAICALHLPARCFGILLILGGIRRMERRQQAWRRQRRQRYGVAQKSASQHNAYSILDGDLTRATAMAFCPFLTCWGWNPLRHRVCVLACYPSSFWFYSSRLSYSLSLEKKKKTFGRTGWAWANILPHTQPCIACTWTLILLPLCCALKRDIFGSRHTDRQDCAFWHGIVQPCDMAWRMAEKAMDGPFAIIQNSFDICACVTFCIAA